MTTDHGLTDADRADIHARLTSWFGDDRQSLLVSHLAPVIDRIKADGYIAGLAAGVEVRASEFQQAALEMARKADQAERRAEDVEAAYERLRAAADLVGHQATCLVDPCDCWMYDLAPLLEYERPEWAKVAESKQGVGDDTWQVVVYEERSGAKCDHQWLDRPESDTHECLICGAEEAGLL